MFWPLTFCVPFDLSDVNECASNPCKNGATCDNPVAEPNKYTCTCAPGWEGTNCDMGKYSDLWTLNIWGVPLQNKEDDIDGILWDRQWKPALSLDFTT